MTHSILLQKLRSAFRISNYLKQNKNITLDELIEMNNLKNFTRRNFLKTSALAAGGLLLPDNFVFAKNKLAPKVVIVGAGISGLNAAYTLKKAGVYAKVFEASKRAGGRILSVKNFITEGSVTELGAEFIDTGHKEMLSLIKEFGFETIDVLNPNEKEFKDIYFFNNKKYFEKDVIEAVLPYMDRFNRDMSFYYQRNVEMIKKFDNISLAEYLKLAGVSGWLYDLINCAYCIDFGADIEQLSALTFIDFAEVDVSTKEFEMYGESDERFKIKGGNQKIVDELFNRVNDRVSFEHVLESISENGNSYKLTFQKSNNSVVDINADIVVLAVPISILKELNFKVKLPQLKIKAINEIAMGQNTKFLTGFNSKIWRKSGLNGNIYTNETFQTGWEHTRLQEAEPAGYTFFLGGSNSINSVKTIEQTNKYISELNKIIPGVKEINNGKRNYSSWRENPFIKGSYSCYLKGQRTTLAEELRKPAGNIFFAGEQTSITNNGYMNGGAETGLLSARAIIALTKGIRK